MGTELQTVNQIIVSAKPNFEKIIEEHKQVNFATEATFAMQRLETNNFLLQTAIKNPSSLKNAILNVATIGLSLNPAQRMAYLVPRDKMVCLDISYIGLVTLACESGAIRWAKAEPVYRNDKYKYNGPGEKPDHEFDPFGDRGDFIGVYVIAKTSDGDFLTDHMSNAEICAIRDRSSGWRAHQRKGVTTPWLTDFIEMAKKTVVKKAFKMWPRVNREFTRLEKAIDLSNTNDGVDFEAEAKVFASEENVEKIKKSCEGMDQEKYLAHLKVKYKREIESFDHLYQDEAEYLLKLIEQGNSNE